MKTILIIGNSWASYNFIKHINKDKYNLRIISKTNDFVYTPFLPKYLVSEFNISQSVPDTIQDEIIDVNFNEKTVYSNCRQYKYDYIIFAIGANANTFNIPGIENCYCVKTLEDVKVLKQELSEKDNVSIIGLGPTGSEIVGYLLDQKKYNITAIDALKMPLNSFHVDLQKKAIALWEKNNVKLQLGNPLIKVDKKYLYFKNGDKIMYDIAIFNGGLKNNLLTSKVLKKMDFDENTNGIPVNQYLSFKNNAFAIGDCSFTRSLPKTAQVASQQGKWLAGYFNNDFRYKKFQYIDRGQICYIGENKSIYQHKNNIFYGNLTKYLNNFIHVYNGINWNQKIEFIHNILFE